MTVQRLEHEMTASEFEEWKAFYIVNPFGSEREDLRFGLLGLRLAQALGVKNPKLKDFIPDFKPRQQQSQTEMMNRWKLFASVHNSAIGASPNG